MKMAKKLLAVVLAGVLALSVLTGCGGAVSTKAIAEAMSDTTIAEAMSDKAIAEAMNDVSKDEGFVYKAVPELNEKAGLIAEKIKIKVERYASGNGKYIYEEIMGIMGEDYAGKYVWIAATTTKGNDVMTQAFNLLEDVDIDGNINSEVADGNPAKVRCIGTALITLNGVDCRLAVITADAVEDKV